MKIDKSRQLSETDLVTDTWYCCFNIETNFCDGSEYHQDGQFFKYLGDGLAELDSNAIGEPNTYDNTPYADFYVKQA